MQKYRISYTYGPDLLSAEEVTRGESLESALAKWLEFARKSGTSIEVVSVMEVF